MTSRMQLPNRRPATTFTVRHGTQSYFVTIGQSWKPGKARRAGFLNLAGPPVEVFVQAEQTSSAVEAVARDAAILLSFALQFGVDAELMRSAVTREADGSPASLIGATLDAMLREFPIAEASSRSAFIEAKTS